MMQKQKQGARNFALGFYKSQTWKAKSRSYRKEHPFCEKCLAKGIYTPSALVHHKTHITAANMNNVEILLGDSNLQALCRDCHAEEHSTKGPSARFDDEGRLIL